MMTLLAFWRLMVVKLGENSHKTHWSRSTDAYLMRRLVQETKELRNALKKGDAKEIGREAADVANFAMMIADNAGAL